MEQTSATWLIVILALLTANLPFAVSRPLIILPWFSFKPVARPWWLRTFFSLLFFTFVFGIARLFYVLISDHLASGAMAALSLWGLIAAFVLLIGLLMAGVAIKSRPNVAEKTVLTRFIELFVLYCLCGVLGFALEQYLGNRFLQTWEFYAITLSLYIVLGYPGFVVRYLMRRPKRTARLKA